MPNLFTLKQPKEARKLQSVAGKLLNGQVKRELFIYFDILRI